MKTYRPGEPNHLKPVLKPLSSGKKRTASHPDKPTVASGPSGLSQSIPLEHATVPPGEPADRSAPVDRPAVPLLTRLSLHVPSFSSHRHVTVPVWLVAILVFAIVAGPVLAVVLSGSGNGHASQDSSVAEVPTEAAAEEREEIPLALEVDELFDNRQWTQPEPPAVSNREQYLLDQGVNPDLEVRYAADEVERLQAELEAIQRNSAMLRSLARQQSGDLSAAYSSLEASQEHTDGALGDLQERIDELEGRIQSVDQLARELRDLLGMPPAESGMGGPLPSVASEEDTDPWLMLRTDIVAIEQWAGSLVFDLDEVNTEIQLRLAQINQSGIPRGSSLVADIEFYDSMPMGWPVDGPITSRFGVRSSPFAGEGGASEMHTGIDIAARTGTPVVATGGGTIQVSGDNGGYGLLVVIDHGRGITTWYGHNSRLLVTPGQRVNAGDVIAEVGSTGRSTGPHVHYEVRSHGVPEDPLPYMQMQR
jgi:hypothetical protein